MKKSIKYITLLTLGITIGTSNLNSIFYATNANQVSAKKVTKDKKSKKHAKKKKAAKKKTKSKLSNSFKQSVKTMVNNLNQQTGDTLTITKVTYPGAYGVRYTVNKDQWVNLSITDKKTFSDGLDDDTNKISSFTNQPIPGVTVVDETNNILARSKVGGGMELVE